MAPRKEHSTSPLPPFNIKLMIHTHLTSRRELGCFSALSLSIATTFVLFASAYSQEAAPTQAATVISSVPFTITKPGVYVIKSDFVFKPATGNAIAVAATAYDVTIDLGGHTLSNSAPAANTNSSVGILISGSGTLVIRNGALHGFSTGVSTTGANANEKSILIDGITCTGCGYSGIMLLNSSDATIRNCLIQDTGYYTDWNHFGIYAYVRTAHISDCRVINIISSNSPANTACAIKSLADNSVVSNCFVVGEETSNTYGLEIDGNAFVVGNSISNCEYGIYAFKSTVKYMNNLTAGCVNTFSGGTGVGTNN